MSNALLERLGFERPPPRAGRARGASRESLARRACSLCQSDERRVAAWREAGGSMPVRACAIDHHATTKER